MIDCFRTTTRKFLESGFLQRGFQVRCLRAKPQRLYIRLDNPTEIRSAIPHSTIPFLIQLVPPLDAALIFETDIVRIRRGQYNHSLAFIYRREESISALVVPLQRPYEEDQTPRQELFDPEQATLRGCQVSSIGPPETHHFWCQGREYQSGLLLIQLDRTSITPDPNPHLDDLDNFILVGIALQHIFAPNFFFSTQFWREGDRVRVYKGEMQDQKGIILSLQHEDATVNVLLDRGEEFAMLLRNVYCVFQPGDFVQVVAGKWKGSQGAVVEVEDNMYIHICPEMDLQVNEIIVLFSYIESYLPDHRQHQPQSSSISETYRPSTPPQVRETQIGDLVFMQSGPSGGIVHSMDEIYLWITDSSPNLVGDLVALHPLPCDLVTTTPPIYITWQSSTAFNVSVGDVLQVVRGPLCGEKDLVKSISPYENRVCLKIEGIGTHQTYIQFCMHMSCPSIGGLQSVVGKTVWAIGGEKKGRWGTLHSLGRSKSRVAFPGNELEIENHYVVTEDGRSLSGHLIPLHLHHAINCMIRRSFVREDHVRTPTPPPLPTSSNENPAWTVTTDDSTVRATSPFTPNYGELSWLMDDLFTFCNTSHMSSNLSEVQDWIIC
ncbi:hypothetical protein JVT61DRAFT_9878 [Boletus reticuloceps]|uniref:KOW domain-containing protein n=1 Tax=Boletus reticuloceps TaxID=495285 RepID=A0A8I2YFR1_9AGAM|nr:hypothetical protein JVT61DRAFT_9878 [Boletus reticuloceps]